VAEDRLPTDLRDPRATLPAAIDAVAGAVDLDSGLSALLTVAAAELGASMSAVLVQDPDRPGLTIAATTGMDEAARAALTAATADPADPFAAAAGDLSPTFDREGLTADGAATVAAYLPVALTSSGVDLALGVLGFTFAAPRSLDEGEREYAIAIAKLAAVTVDRARLASTAAERSEWFERLAHSDALTGLANERTVGRVLELELARAGRQTSEVSLAIFDIDDFQATNRDGGHAAGDDVLRRVAAVLAESVRLVDTVGRIGGDEFVLIAPGSAGVTVAQRVLDGITALPAVGGRTVSVSAGVARFPVDGSDADELIAAAMAALQTARAEGRGHVAEPAAAPKA
jgi:diguanylate cyclase (GGDEF)-like protein